MINSDSDNIPDGCGSARDHKNGKFCHYLRQISSECTQNKFQHTRSENCIKQPERENAISFLDVAHSILMRNHKYT